MEENAYPDLGTSGGRIVVVVCYAEMRNGRLFSRESLTHGDMDSQVKSDRHPRLKKAKKKTITK